MSDWNSCPNCGSSDYTITSRSEYVGICDNNYIWCRCNRCGTSFEGKD